MPIDVKNIQQPYHELAKADYDYSDEDFGMENVPADIKPQTVNLGINDNE